jgi:hypothetical protein
VKEELLKNYIMKKLLFISVFLCRLLALAQSPQLNVKGKDSAQVTMSQLLVHVKLVGNIAYTTTEMHFKNTNSRQMEAELLFPLPEGVSVSRYAIDINGKMRDAVPVNKSKGKQVFEAIEHRRVDPGLLEKVEGNNFKTRIYPILPNKERIVVIGYEEELANFDSSNLAYQLVSRYPQKLEKFELDIVVLGASSAPSMITDTNEVSTLITTDENQWNRTYQMSIKKNNYQPTEKLTIKIPIQQDIPSVIVQSVDEQHYFYASTFIDGKKIPKKNPKTIGLIWDVSLSCKNRDLKKELGLLDTYFKALQNVQVSLYFLSYNYELQNTFTIVNGDWSSLKNKLEQATYDGATRFSTIKWSPFDEYLFFTDGLSSLSQNDLIKANKPVNIITSLASADYAFMNYSATKTGGSFINLNTLTVNKGLDKLTNQNLKFLGIKDNYLVTELYPMIGSLVSGSFNVSGISLKAKNEIILLFGYDHTAIFEKKITIDASKQVTSELNIEKLWAQKKIATLEIQYKKNADEIELLGKKHGIVTQNTSLIVLEDINDYIQYDIIPPAELRPEFDRILKEQRAQRLAEQKSNWGNVENYYNQLYSWWNSNLKFKNPETIAKQKVIAKPVRVVYRRPRNSSFKNIGNGYINGIVMSNSEPLPGARIMVKGTTIAVSTGFDGAFTINAKKGEWITVSFVGFNSKEFIVGKSKFYNVILNENAQTLDEVVVVGYGTAKRKELTGSVQAIRQESQSSEKSLEKKDNRNNESQYLQGIASGVQISNSNGIPGSSAIIPSRASNNLNVLDTISNNRHEQLREVVKVNSWNPDRIYLKVIAAAPEEKKYEAYLQLREEQLNNPSFYFDIANYFYANKDKQKALLILSTIADLGLENHQLYKSLTYQLRQWEAYEDALYTASQVAKWRDFEPQSFRDLGLTLEDNKQYQAGFDTLVKALEVNYFGTMSGHYQGVEDIILMDINRMMSEHRSIKTDKLDKKYLSKMPVAVRIILNWNQMDTDIDLHVIEPTGEECFFGHSTTNAGARFSKDFTQGYGPEQYLLRNIVKGKFQIKTNFYGESALTENGPTTVMVEVYITKNGKTERKLQTIQLGKVKQNENLAEIAIQ